jgi:GNAT superfamily N-acetyltransferase
VLPIRVAPLGAAHDLGGFACGVVDLDEFLRDDALRLQGRRVARVYVALAEDRIVGYVALVADSLVLETREKRTLKLKHGDPVWVPAVKIGRLAICSDYQRHGVGKKLMRFAVDIANHVSDTIGCRLMTLDALPSAISYYEGLGFIRNKLANKRSKKTDDKKSKPKANGDSAPVSMRLDLHAEVLPDWVFDN